MLTPRAYLSQDSHIIRYGSIESAQGDSGPLNALEASVTTLRDDFLDVCRAGSLLDYLGPILDVVKSSETSGRLTAAALQGVQRILERDLIGRWGGLGGPGGETVTSGSVGHASGAPSAIRTIGGQGESGAPGASGVSGSIVSSRAEDVAVGVRMIAEAVTQCKFESSRTDQDECVLDRILDVFTALIQCPQSKYLRHEDVVAVFQACYRIGHMRTDRGKHSSSILTQSSQRAMKAFVQAIFSRVGRGELVEVVTRGAATDDEYAELQGTKSPLSVVSRQLVDLDDDEDDENDGDDGDDGDEVVESRSGEDDDKEKRTKASDELSKEETPEDGPGGPHQESGDPGSPRHEQPVTVSVSVRTESASPARAVNTTDAADHIHSTAKPQPENYGVPALAEVLAFIISMIGSKPSKHYPELPLAGLELVCTCIRACTSPYDGSRPLPTSLMLQLKQDLFRALFSASSHGVNQSRSLTAICQVGVLLYALYRDSMLPQVDALVSLLILPIAESSKQLVLRRTALEGLLDFCRQPGFLATMFVNCDCRIGGVGGIGESLFKRICAVISDSASVRDEEGLPKFHGVAMEGIRTVFDAISDIRDDLHSKTGASHGHAHGYSHSRKSSFGFGGQDPSKREYVDIWTPLCAGDLLDDELSSASPTTSLSGSSLRPSPIANERQLKSLLVSVADRFNESQKKGLEYCQEVKLLPTPLTARAVARFLKGCPGLSKSAIGEVLGERDQFYEEIREEFCDTFNFGGMRFDVALRLFMDAFRPPGEGQKIDRIVQSFGKKYFEQVPKSGLRSADAAYVLAFSVIMLNTDLHNTQNKRKMTLEDFGRINRNTNEGDPMPAELLSSIYAAISVDEFKISSECSAADLSHQAVFWATLAEVSAKPRGRPVNDAAMVQALYEMRREVFVDAWGSALGAISSILDASANPKTVKNATATLSVAADLGYRYRIENVIDQVLEVLVKYTSALDYPEQSTSPKPSLAYGASIKARSSVETMFKIADMYGDSIKSGWACIVSTVMKVFAAELLTPEIIAVDGESMEQVAERMPKPRPRNKGPSSSIFTRAINSLISIEADGDLAYANAGGEMLRDMAKKSISSCSIESLVNDSKFLIVESLIELISAIIASGKAALALAKTDGTGGSNAAPIDTAELALELLFSLSLRNRDRITLFWPRIHEFLAVCTSQDSSDAKDFTVLNKRAIEGLMRICQRLLPYKEDTADMLLGSLSLVGEMRPRIVWELAPSISNELVTLLSQSAPHIRTETGWRTIAILIRISASREEVLPHALQALQLACQNPQAVSTESYIPLLETCLQLIDGFKGVNPEVAVECLECADALFSWLSSSCSTSQTSSTSGAGTPAGQPLTINGTNGTNVTKLASTTIIASTTTTASATVLDLWLTTVGILTKGLCRESSGKIRHTSVEALHRMLISSSSLNLPPDMWVQTLRELVLPLVSDFSKAVAASSRKKSLPEHIKSLQMAIDMLTNVLIKYTWTIAVDNDFGALWESTFVVLREAATSSHDRATSDMVRERTQTLLSSLKADGTLCETWKDGAGNDLWTVTKTGACAIPGIEAGSLFASVVDRGADRSAPLMQPDHPVAPQEDAKAGQPTQASQEPAALAEMKANTASDATQQSNAESEEPPTCQQS